LCRWDVSPNRNEKLWVFPTLQRGCIAVEDSYLTERPRSLTQSSLKRSHECLHLLYRLIFGFKLIDCDTSISHRDIQTTTCWSPYSTLGAVMPFLEGLLVRLGLQKPLQENRGHEKSSTYLDPGLQDKAVQISPTSVSKDEERLVARSAICAYAFTLKEQPKPTNQKKTE
jgi:hypothetical protein